MYHYLESGLKNIYLVNGFRSVETPHGEAVSIDDIEGLHHAIAWCLIEQQRNLIGSEVRFIRKFLDMTQKRMAEMAHVTELTIHNWEKARSLHARADRWVRLFFLEEQGTKKFSELINELNAIDRSTLAKGWMFEDTGEGWRAKAA